MRWDRFEAVVASSSSKAESTALLPPRHRDETGRVADEGQHATEMAAAGGEKEAVSLICSTRSSARGSSSLIVVCIIGCKMSSVNVVRCSRHHDTEVDRLDVHGPSQINVPIPNSLLFV